MFVLRKTLFKCSRLTRVDTVNCLRTAASASSHRNVLNSEASIEVPNVTFLELIFEKIQRFHGLTATISGSNGRSYTFEQVRIKSRNLSKALRQKFKLKDGDVIAFLLPNIPEYVICFLGSLEARLTVTTMNPMYTADEIAKQILDASPKVIVTQAPLLNVTRSALNLTKRHLPIITIKETQAESVPDGTIDFSELISVNLDIPDIQPGSPDDVALMPYSSGTTGLPKGVQLTHRNSVANLLQMTHPDVNIFRPTTNSFQEVSPAVLPFFHIYGLMLNFLFLFQGGKCVTLNKFTPELYIAALEKYPISLIFAAPPLVLFLSAHPGVRSEYLSHLKALSCGAAPLGYLDEERFMKKVGKNIQIIQGYGLTEAAPVVTFTPKKQERSEKTAGSVGKAVANTSIKIIDPEDPEGKPLGPHEKGEILIRGPQVMKGYFNRPEETKNTFLDGWLRTGDIGYYDETQLLFITDRLKELIKVRGFQVAPAELEQIIRDHPAVADAGVIGVPHPINGEVPRAYVVPKKDTTLNIDALDQFVAEKVAKYKKLEGGISIVDSIPKNPSGKILRRQLKLGFMEKGI